jgi:hypothetical protein
MPDDYLTVDEVAAQLALPLEMIQRRIESGDIPVHWVEVNGKLEMRISAAEIGVGEAGRAPTPFPSPEGFVGGEAPAGADEEVVAPGWRVRESQYPSDVWPSAEVKPAASAAPPPTPWEVSAEGDLPAADVAQPGEPVWRPEPGTWEDEPLDEGATAEPTPQLSPFNPTGTDAFFPLNEDAPSDYAAPPPPVASGPFPAPAGPVDSDYAPPPPPVASGPFPAPAEPVDSDYAPPPPPIASGPFTAPAEPVDSDYAPPRPPVASGPFTAPAEPVDDEDEEEAPFGSDEEEDEESILAVEDGLDLEAPLPSEVLGVPEQVEVPRPSALAAAQGPDSALAVNSIDARELVAGLFERWERALEQRIQAEQRLRFEAELERRLRQVRDLRQELDNTRKSTAAQLAEREQEVLALRNRLREQGPAPKSRGLFRR